MPEPYKDPAMAIPSSHEPQPMTTEDAKAALGELIAALKGNPQSKPNCSMSCREGSCGCSSGTCNISKLKRAATCMLHCNPSSIKNCMKSAKRTLDARLFPMRLVPVGVDDDNTARARYKKAFETLLHGKRKELSYRTGIHTSEDGSHGEVGSKKYCYMNCRSGACSDFSRATKCMARCPAGEIKNCLGVIGSKVVPNLKRVISQTPEVMKAHQEFESVGNPGLDEHLKIDKQRHNLVHAEKAFMNLYKLLEDELSGTPVKPGQIHAVKQRVMKYIIGPLTMHQSTVGQFFNTVFEVFRLNPYRYFEFKQVDVIEGDTVKRPSQILVEPSLEKAFIIGNDSVTIVDLRLVGPQDKQLTKEGRSRDIHRGKVIKKLTFPNVKLLTAAALGQHGMSTTVSQENHTHFELFVAAKTNDGDVIFVVDTLSNTIKKDFSKRYRTIRSHINQPTALAYDEDTGYLYVANGGSHTVSVFAMQGLRQEGGGQPEYVAEIPVGVAPSSLLLVDNKIKSRMGVQDHQTLYVASALSDTVMAIPIVKESSIEDMHKTYMGVSFAEQGEEVGTLKRPTAMAVDEETNRLFVATAYGKVMIIDMETHKIQHVLSFKPHGEKEVSAHIEEADVDNLMEDREDAAHVITALAFGRYVGDISASRATNYPRLFVVDNTYGLIHIVDPNTGEEFIPFGYKKGKPKAGNKKDSLVYGNQDLSSSMLTNVSLMPAEHGFRLFIVDAGERRYELTAGEEPEFVEMGTNGRVLVLEMELGSNFAAKLKDLKSKIKGLPRRLASHLADFSVSVVRFAVKTQFLALAKKGVKTGWRAATFAFPPLQIVDGAMSSASRIAKRGLSTAATAVVSRS